MDTPRDNEMEHTRGIAGAFSRLSSFWQTAVVAAMLFVAGGSSAITVLAFIDLPAEVKKNREAIGANSEAILALQRADRMSVRDRDDIRDRLSQIQCMLFALDSDDALVSCIDDPAVVRP